MKLTYLLITLVSLSVIEQTFVWGHVCDHDTDPLIQETNKMFEKQFGDSTKKNRMLTHEERKLVGGSLQPLRVTADFSALSIGSITTA